MAVDWVADFSGPVAVPPRSSLQLTVMKLKEEEAGKGEIFGIVRGMKEKFDSIEQLTVGENFLLERSKVFSIASIAVVKDLESLGEQSDLVNEQKDKAREFLDVVEKLVDELFGSCR